jgi:hypothetical protein
MNLYYDFSSVAEEQRLIVVLEGNRVCFSWQGQVLHLNKTLGISYLVELLLHPYMSISATALHSLVNHAASPVGAAWGLEEDGYMCGSSFQNILPQPLCDPQAIREVKLKLNLLTVQIAEAQEWNDLARLEEMKLERDALLDYLKDSLSMRNAQTLSADLDYKCADSVYGAINYTLKSLEKQYPPLGRLLRKSLHLWAQLLFIPADNLSVLVMEGPSVIYEDEI